MNAHHHNFVGRVGAFIEKHRLLSHGQKLLVALSGGADSVALLLVLKQLGYDVEAAHCNFHLRGEESDRDEAFCKTLCEERGVALHCAHFDTKAFAQLHHVSVEMAARRLRYAYFEGLCKDVGTQRVCVAHHRGDLAETVLMNMVRGTGLEGLKGMKPLNGWVARPLLGVTRKEIEEYLEHCSQTFVTDSTNLEDDARRNVVRHQVMPVLQEVNDAAAEHICMMAERVGEILPLVEKALDEEAQKAMTQPTERHRDVEMCLNVDKINKQYVLFHLLKPYHFSSDMVTRIFSHLDATTGTTFNSPTHQVMFDRGRMWVLRKVTLAEGPYVIPMTGLYRVADEAHLRIEQVEYTSPRMVSREQWILTVDAHKTSFPLHVRRLRASDRFQPFGMEGTKLVSDFLTDKKMPLFMKQRQWVVTDAQDRIVWLVGQRADQRFCVDDNTSNLLVLTWTDDVLTAKADAPHAEGRRGCRYPPSLGE